MLITILNKLFNVPIDNTGIVEDLKKIFEKKGLHIHFIFRYKNDKHKYFIHTIEDGVMYGGGWNGYDYNSITKSLKRSFLPYAFNSWELPEDMIDIYNCVTENRT